jgi:hypothetical protein
LLLLVASVLALAGIVVWQSSSARTSPTPPAAVQLQPVTVPAPSNDVVVAAPSKADAAPAPTPVPATDTAPPATRNKKAPARVERREPAATVAVERRANTVPPSAPNANKAPARATNYEQRVNAAAAAEDSDRALVDLQRLATDEPNRPEAYEAMAGINLTKKDYAQARERIESALAKGGKATFTAIHDHSRGNFDSDDPKSTCVGELTILADEVRFEPREGTDRFSASWANVRDAGSNKFFGSGRGGFHVTVSDGGKYKNFNLAPGSKDKDEGKLILDLLKSYSKRADRTK